MVGRGVALNLYQLTEEQLVFLDLVRRAINKQSDKKDPLLNVEQIQKVMAIAKQQHLHSMAYEMIKDTAGYKAIPESLQHQWEEECTTQITYQILYEQAMLQLKQTFEKEKIPFIILKGLSCKVVYKDPYLRPSSDEDILIDIKDLFRCDRILNSLGYVAEEHDLLKAADNDPEKFRTLRELHYYSEIWGLQLEVHLNSVGMENEINRTLNEHFSDVLDHIWYFEINGNKFPGLDPTHQFLHVFAHFYRHLREEGVGLRQLMDVALTAQYYEDQIEWDSVAAIMERLSVKVLFETILRIAEEYLDIKCTTCANYFMEKEINLVPLLADIFQGGVYGHGEEGIRRYSTFVTDGENKKVGLVYLVKRILFPGTEAICNRYPVCRIHRYLLPLYYIVRIFQMMWEYKDIKKLRNVKKGLSERKERLVLLSLYDIK